MPEVVKAIQEAAVPTATRGAHLEAELECALPCPLSMQCQPC